MYNIMVINIYCCVCYYLILLLIIFVCIVGPKSPGIYGYVVGGLVYIYIPMVNPQKNICDFLVNTYTF